MKKVILTCLFLLLVSPSFALATWTEGFFEDADNLGLDRAIENALDNDITPQEILTFVLDNFDELDPRSPMKILYCAGANWHAIRNAANKLGITVKEVSAALEESIAECGTRLALNDRDIFEIPNSGNVASPSKPMKCQSCTNPKCPPPTKPNRTPPIQVVKK